MNKQSLRKKIDELQEESQRNLWVKDRSVSALTINYCISYNRVFNNLKPMGSWVVITVQHERIKNLHCFELN